MKGKKKAKKSKQRIGPLYITAFVLLSLATLALVAFSLSFFTWAPVRMQLRAWASQAAPTTLLMKLVQEALPRPPSTAASLAPMVDFTPQPEAAPTLAPSPTPGRNWYARSLRDEPARLLPTQPPPPPVYQVVEKPPPEGSLVIPSLGVDQPIVPVPVVDQQWDLASLGEQVGWLQTTGAYPIDDLSMVFVGHITLPPPGGAGPFLNLSALKTGDLVKYRTRELTFVYEVEGETVIEPGHVDRLYVPDGGRILLVTCTGYNALERRYDLRLVIEAKLIAVE